MMLNRNTNGVELLLPPSELKYSVLLNQETSNFFLSAPWITWPPGGIISIENLVGFEVVIEESNKKSSNGSNTLVSLGLIPIKSY